MVAVLLIIVFGAAFAVWHESRFLRQSLSCRSWTRTSCSILKIARKRPVNSDICGELIAIEYSYEVNGNRRLGACAFPGSDSTICSSETITKLVERCTSSVSMDCCVNPSNDSESVIFRDILLTLSAKLIITMLIFITSVFFLLLMLINPEMQFSTQDVTFTPFN